MKEQRTTVTWRENVPNKPQKEKLRVLYCFVFSPNRIVFCFLHKFWCFVKCDTFYSGHSLRKAKQKPALMVSRGSKPPLSCFNDSSLHLGRGAYHISSSLSDRYLAGTQHPRLCSKVQLWKKF